MMKEILDEVKNELISAGADSIYTAFDAGAFEQKGSGFFTLLNAAHIEETKPVFSQYALYIPYRAELEISVTAPERCSLEKLYEYFDSRILPGIDGMAGLSCRMSKLSMKHDSNIRRLVLTARIAVSGMRKAVREKE